MSILWQFRDACVLFFLLLLKSDKISDQSIPLYWCFWPSHSNRQRQNQLWLISESHLILFLYVNEWWRSDRSSVTDSGDEQLTWNFCQCRWGPDTCLVSSDSCFWLLLTCQCCTCSLRNQLHELRKKSRQSTLADDLLTHPTSFLATLIRVAAIEPCQLLNSSHAQSGLTKHFIFATAIFMTFVNLYHIHP